MSPLRNVEVLAEPDVPTSVAAIVPIDTAPPADVCLRN
jgi:hypothetical protein